MNFPGSKIRQQKKRQDLVTILLLFISVGIVVLIILGIVFLIVRPFRPGNPDRAAQTLINSANRAGVPITPEEKMLAEEKQKSAEDAENAVESEDSKVPEITDDLPLENSIPELYVSLSPVAGGKSTKPEKKPTEKKPDDKKPETNPSDSQVSQEGKIPPPPPAAKVKVYTIDLGSFTDENEVKAKVVELKNLGLNPKINKISDTQFNLSVSEKFDSLDFATAMRDRLIEQGFSNAKLKTD